ncbi:MAG: hypothetical protein MRY83_12285 [Flavobacteriales bacterium]|nr:hypothetical protein [Flavobacteriales bacterium]
MTKTSVTALMGILIFWNVHTHAQLEWTFIKEVDNIKLYISEDANSSLKKFRTVFEVDTDIKQFCNAFRDPWNIKRWGTLISDFEVFGIKDGIMYYRTVMDAPWPLQDRASVMQIEIEEKLDRGLVTVQKAKSYDYKIPEEYVEMRIAHFTWDLEAINSKTTKVIYQGVADPSGNIPVWLTNQLLEKNPIEYVQKVKAHFQQNL